MDNKKKVTIDNYDITSPYERTIVLNEQLGLVPKRPRYSVIGEDFYGVYDDYCEALSDTKGLQCEIIKDDKNSTWEAMQTCYNKFFRNNGKKYMMESIDKGNELIFLEKRKLFTVVN